MVMTLVTTLIPQKFLDIMDDLVRDGFFPSRSDAIRSAIRYYFIEGIMAERLKTFQKPTP